MTASGIRRFDEGAEPPLLLHTIATYLDSSSRASPLLLFGHSIFVLTIPFRCHAYAIAETQKNGFCGPRRELARSLVRKYRAAHRRSRR